MEIDVAGLRAAWRAMKDTHEFFPLLRKFKLARTQALRLAHTDFAYRVGNDAARTMLGDRLPAQDEGFQLESRLTPWLLALFAGPALLFDRLAKGWREGALSRADIASGAFITAGWAGIYGFILLKGAHFLGA